MAARCSVKLRLNPAALDGGHGPVECAPPADE
jgi:hypothetical protein